MNNPLVSIPVFVYNGERFLKKQLDSLINQTYENIEIIICDDCSKDTSIKIIKEYEKFTNFTYYSNNQNLGVYKNVEKGLLLCKGEYIAPCDHDDIWMPEKIETLVNNIKDNVLIYSTSTPIDEDDRIIDNFSSHNNKLIKGNNNKAFFFDNCVSGHTIMFKKELLSYLVPLPSNVYPDWWIAFVASSYSSIDYYKDSLVYYRRHNSQMTKTNNRQKPKLYKKIFFKEEEKKASLKRKIDILSAFSSLSILDKDTKILLDKIIFELKKFPNLYINKNLIHLLNQNKQEIFAMANQKDHYKLVKNLARGIWYYRIKLYT